MFISYFYDRKEDNNIYALSGQYIDEIEASNMLKMRQNQLNSMARSDLMYNLHFVPIFKTRRESKFSYTNPSIYINNFWVNGVKVLYLPSKNGISLSLAPGRYNFKVEYVVSNYFEEHIYYLFNNKERYYTPKVNETKILELNDVYIDETREYFLCLPIVISSVLNVYYDRNNYPMKYQFIKYNKSSSLYLADKDGIINCCEGSLGANLYPHHYAMNRDYSSSFFKNGLYDMIYTKTYHTFNKPYKIATKEGKYWSYKGPFVNDKVEGKAYCNNHDEGFEFFGQFVDGETYGFGAKFYPNGNIAFGFNLNYFKLSGPVLYFYPSGNFEYVLYDDDKKIKGFLFFKDNSVKETKYDEYGNSRSSFIEDRYLNIIHECVTFKEYKTFKRVEYSDGYYIGEVNDSNKPHGIGCINYKNGNRYCGNFFNGYRNGYGVFYYSDGSYVYSEFKNGIAHGQGRVYKSNCSPKFVYYNNNKIEKTFWFDKESITSTTKVDTKKTTATTSKATSSINSVTKETKTVYSTSAVKPTAPISSSKPAEKVVTKKVETKPVNEQYVYSDGAIYYGPMKNNLPHGVGTITYINGDKYIGNIYLNEIKGYGTLFYKDGSIYRGNFEDGKQNGHGTYECKNYVYVGDFVNNKKHGKGELTYSNKEKYVGEFKDDLRHGSGEYYNSFGRLLYKGNWIKDIYDDPNKIKHKFVYENAVLGPNDKKFFYGNCTYIGLHKDNKPHLLGTFYFDDGITYSGAHFNLKRDNFGILIYKDASYYVGEFIEDKKEGFGIEVTDKNHFNFGFRKDSVDNGIKVVVTYSDFVVYVMENGKIKDILYRGTMNNNPFVELKLPYNYAYFGPELYIGQFDGRKRHGFGKLLMNKDVYIGQFVNDDFSGIGCYKFSDGVTYIGQFDHGAMSGIGIVFDRYGNINVKRYYNNEEIAQLY